MDEQTTTGSQDENTGAEALPVQGQQDTAATTANEQQVDGQQQNGDANASVPAADDKLKSWAESKGIQLDSENAVKAAKIAMDNQAAFQQKAQKSSELEKTITSGTQQAIEEATASGNVDTAELALARVAALELQNSVNTFFASTPEAKEKEQAMVQLITERPQIGLLVRQGHLGLSDLYSMVKGSDPTVTEEAKTQGATEALQQLANKQTAAAVPGAGTTSAVSPPEGNRLMDLWS